MTKKEIADSFLKMASCGKVQDAYAKYIHPKFRHHNPYFKGDRQSLLKGMEENARQFPEKTYQTLRAVEEGNFVAIHGRVALAPDSNWSVVHIFRFEGNLIVEEWEATQDVPQESPNDNGIF